MFFYILVPESVGRGLSTFTINPLDKKPRRKSKYQYPSGRWFFTELDDLRLSCEISDLRPSTFRFLYLKRDTSDFHVLDWDKMTKSVLIEAPIQVRYEKSELKALFDNEYLYQKRKRSGDTMFSLLAERQVDE